MWPIFEAVVAAGDTYALPPETPREEAYLYWFGEGVASFVAKSGGQVVGMYKLVANQPGLGSHVANASFMVAPSARGLGVGRAMGRDCLRRAREAGFLALQFNFVVSTNESAAGPVEGSGIRDRRDPPARLPARDAGLRRRLRHVSLAR